MIQAKRKEVHRSTCVDYDNSGSDHLYGDCFSGTTPVDCNDHCLSNIWYFCHCLLAALNIPNPIITQLVPIKAMYKGVCPIDSDNNNPNDGAISLKTKSTMPHTKRSEVVTLDLWQSDPE